jgi:hypothetical protein
VEREKRQPTPPELDSFSKCGCSKCSAAEKAKREQEAA